MGRRWTLSDGRTSRGSSVLADLRDNPDNSMALLVQLLLSLDRRDLAQSTYTQAKRVGNDSALVQAMEAWIGLKTVSLGSSRSVPPLFILSCPILSPFIDPCCL